VSDSPLTLSLDGTPVDRKGSVGDAIDRNRPTAPGEVCEAVFSDRGSTPLASTKRIKSEPFTDR